ACNRLERQERSDPYKDDCSEVLEACTTGGEPKDDVARYADWSFRRCAAGWDGGCDAVMTLRRRKVSTTPARAKEQGTWLEAGCLEGAAGACGILALGKVVPLEPSEKVLQSGCSLGVAQSCEKLAQAAEARGDSVAQLQFLEQACPPVTSQGSESISSSACRAAGVMYKDGVGASRDLARAALLLQKGCVARRYVLDGKACEVLGTMFEGGVGVQKSLARAVDLYAAGCAREKYESTLQSLAESKAKRFGGKDAPLSPSPPQESTACARLRQWTKPKSESGG
ncbi:MAG: sel1 repeat family protein, partial [Myxococcales bacterium]|nr:sel1 repeat family protein [Myxococcales bacterium]